MSLVLVARGQKVRQKANSGIMSTPVITTPRIQTSWRLFVQNRYTDVASTVATPIVPQVSLLEYPDDLPLSSHLTVVFSGNFLQEENLRFLRL